MVIRFPLLCSKVVVEAWALVVVHLVQIASNSGKKDSSSEIEVALVGSNDFLVQSDRACIHSATANKVGRIGPKMVLNPAHPTLSRFNKSCNAQQDELNNPTSVLLVHR